jgi:hypothetical protein
MGAKPCHDEVFHLRGNAVAFGEPAGVRTRDLLIKSQSNSGVFQGPWVLFPEIRRN